MTEWEAGILAALDLLEEFLPAPSWLTVHILEADPIWRPLHGHPRFESFAKRIGLR